MKILFSSEQNSGGGAVSNINLAKETTSFATVAFFGIGYNFDENRAIIYYDSKSKQPLRLRYFFDYRHAIRNFNPDIVHSTGMYTGILALLIRILSRRKFRIVMTLHHTFRKFRMNYIAVRLVKYLNKVDTVHFLTDYQRMLYSDYGLKPQNYRIIPNIIVPRDCSVIEVNNLRKKLINEISSEWLIVFVGRLVESKQIDVFIRTIKLINQCGFNAGGVVVGNGDNGYVRELKNLAEEINIHTKLLFTGFTSRPELYIKACDFCMFPTLGEALPLFIIESFSLKKTMVLSNHPSISNTVSDNIDSMVVSDHAADMYAEKCIQLIKNPELLRKLEAGAYSTYNQYYELDSVVKKFKNMYSDLYSGENATN
jgi:glycosyltransferase involved in cell wall biosynthesis